MRLVAFSNPLLASAIVGDALQAKKQMLDVIKLLSSWACKCGSLFVLRFDYSDIAGTVHREVCHKGSAAIDLDQLGLIRSRGHVPKGGHDIRRDES